MHLQRAFALLSLCASGCASELDAATSAPVEVAGVHAALTFDGCDPNGGTAQQDAISAAVADAQRAMDDARSDVYSVLEGGDSTRFEYWFGSPADQERVKRIAQNLGDSLAVAENRVYQCGCPGLGPDVLGDTSPNNTEAPIRLCDGYFDDKQPYWEIRVGVVIHELMHTGSHMSDVQGGVPCTFEDNHDRPASGAADDLDFASKNPENYRLYALDWQPGKRSESVMCSKKRRAWPNEWNPLP